jgi:hypothetical protein
MYYLSYLLRLQRTLGLMRKQEIFSLRYNTNCSAIVPRKNDKIECSEFKLQCTVVYLRNAL